MEIGILVFGFIVGAVLGSFVKAIADRTILNISFKGRSYCDSCKRSIKWYDLFPIISYLSLKGRCRYCKKKIPLEDLLAEFTIGILSALTFAIIILPRVNLLFLTSWDSLYLILKLIFSLAVLSIMGIIFLVDLKTYLIPDRIVFPSMVLATSYLLILSVLRSITFYLSLSHNPFGKYLLPPYSNYFLDNIERLWLSSLENVAAGLVAALFFVILIILTSGRGMGWGDVKYVFFLGLVLGFPFIAVALLISFILGAIFSLILIFLKRKSFGQTIPFGPFLSLGGLVTLLFGEQILNFYLSFSLNLIH